VSGVSRSLHGHLYKRDAGSKSGLKKFARGEPKKIRRKAGSIRREVRPIRDFQNLLKRWEKTKQIEGKKSQHLKGERKHMLDDRR